VILDSVRARRFPLSCPPSKMDRIKALFKSQKLAVLATQEETVPYLSLMAFAFTEDLSCLLVATKRATRKYLNMKQNPGVSLLMDNRSHKGDLFQDTVVVTCIGKAESIEDSQKAFFQDLFLRHHPDLTSLVQSPDCALIKITVNYYYILNRFDQVEEFKVT
jgi:heme iron utilization protein